MSRDTQGAVSTISPAKRYFAGTHRTATPQETLEHLQPRLGAMGITRVSNVTHLDRIGIPVAQAVRPNSRSIAVHQGKGQTLEAALASAAMEAAESWHAQNIRLAKRKESWASLARRVPVVDAAMVPTRSEQPLDQTQPINWVAGLDLCNDERTWVPLSMVDTDFTYTSELPGLPRSSNGLAAGNHPAEAIVTALCEIIERDAIAVWQQLPLEDQADRRIIPQSIDDVSCRTLIERVESASITPTIYDLTTDMGVPVFACRLIDKRDGNAAALGASHGFGCHPARCIALSRAITEAAQTRLARISGARDDIDPEIYRDSGERLLAACVHDYVTRATSRDFERGPDFHSLDLTEDLGWLLHSLRRAGIGQAVAVDLTHSELDISVVRMVVPGVGRRTARGRFDTGRRSLLAEVR